MAQQETGGGTGEPSLTEEVQAQPETSNEAGTETPALSTGLNRAERRAQAKGKKAGGGSPNANLSSSGGARGPNPRATGAAIPVRVNRTGSRSK
jgi:hypothetical protein